jgi:hypothetical protein
MGSTLQKVNILLSILCCQFYVKINFRAGGRFCGKWLKFRLYLKEEGEQLKGSEKLVKCQYREYTASMTE